MILISKNKQNCIDFAEENKTDKETLEMIVKFPELYNPPGEYSGHCCYFKNLSTGDDFRVVYTIEASNGMDETFVHIFKQ